MKFCRKPSTGKFNWEPTLRISKKLNYSAKKGAFFAIWTENLLRKDSQFERLSPNSLFKQLPWKSHPEKNWREFWIVWNIGAVTYQKNRFLIIIYLYSNVEKIKTIGSTFMAASGMNPSIRQVNQVLILMSL
jgi:hypothetical protein